MSGLALGIDIGTSGIRTAVIDRAGAPVSSARAPHRPQPAERIDAELWWAAVGDCVRAQIAALEAGGLDPAHIGALAVDGTSGTMVLVDANLRPVTRALMYNSGGFDEEAARIARFAPDPHITRGTGSALARAFRLVSEDRAGSAALLCHQADFISARLMRRGGTSDQHNALKTGFDPGGAGWPDWLAAAGMPCRLLPDIVAPGARIGDIDPVVADALGLPRTARVHAGTTDSVAAFLAAGATGPGTAVTSLGTTLAVKLVCAARIDDPAIGLYSHRLGDLWLVGGASNAGGGVLADHFAADRLAALSKTIDPRTQSGLDYYPLSRPGERFPVNDPGLRPRLEPRPGDDALFLKGMLEGLARIERRAYEALAARGAPWPNRIFTAGGGAGNTAWTAIRGRILGMVPVPAPHREAAIGAARLACS